MVIDIRTSELIAIGSSVAANCQICLQYHVGKAREIGVGPEEIAGAIEVGRMVGKGAAASMKKFASTLTTTSESADVPIPSMRLSVLRRADGNDHHLQGPGV
jgi:AhpD family alkylhydroperoxidase